MLSFDLCSDNSLDGPFPLQPGGHYVHDVQKQSDMWTQTTADFSTLPQSISDELGPEKPAVFLGVVDICLCLCMVEFDLDLVDVEMNCVN